MANEIILVVGRSKNVREFADNIGEALNNKFKISGDIHSLGEKSEIDNQERFIAFIASNAGSDFDYQVVTSKIQNFGYSVRWYETMEEAIEYAKETFDFQHEDDEEDEEFERLKKEFPPFTTEEMEQFGIFDALYRTNRLYPMRGKLNDEEIVVLASVVYGQDQIRVTPFSVMLTDEMQEGLQLPYMEESD